MFLQVYCPTVDSRFQLYVIVVCIYREKLLFNKFEFWMLITIQRTVDFSGICYYPEKFTFKRIYKCIYKHIGIFASIALLLITKEMDTLIR